MRDYCGCGGLMNSGKSIFAQLMDFLPSKAFRRCVTRYQGDYKLKSFSCWDQFLCMAFAQLTYRESLRDIEACLRAQQTKLYHLGIRGQVSRNTLAHANTVRDWRIYADFAQVLITRARVLYADDNFGIELAQTVYALDATTIDLCLALFPWAKFRKHKGAVKLHTLLDLRGNIPTVVIITHGKVHEVNILDQLHFEAGAFYVMDRGYLDFARLYKLHLASAFFVTRAKKRFDFQRLYSQPVDRTTGVLCDQTVTLVNPVPHQGYPEKLRRIRYRDALTNQRLVFLTNNFSLPPLTIAQRIAAVGRSSCSSNGSSSTCASRISTALPRTPCGLKSGSPSRFMCWSPSSKRNCTSRAVSTECYRSAALLFSRKPPFYGLFLC
jgi:hypothetical protein